MAKMKRWTGTAWEVLDAKDADTVDGKHASDFANASHDHTSITGNAGTATKLATPRTISLTGDATGSTTYDGSSNSSINVTIVDDSHNHIIANVDNLQTTLDKKVDTNDYTMIVPYVATTGSANTYVATLSPAPTLVEGLALAVKINVTNTGASTINVNGLGAKSILKSNGNAVSSGNLKAGSIYTLRYNGTAFILQGEGGEYGTATADKVLTGYTIGTENGIVSGTMPNNSGKTQEAVSTYSEEGFVRLRPPKGYYDGVSGSSIDWTDGNFKKGNIKSGVTIFGQTGTFTSDANATASQILSGQTAYVKGNKITGTMPNNGAKIITPSTTNQAISAGYHNGSGYVKGDANLKPENIKSGVSIFGVAGTLLKGRATASGTLTFATSTYDRITKILLPDFNFYPWLIITYDTLSTDCFIGSFDGYYPMTDDFFNNVPRTTGYNISFYELFNGSGSHYLPDDGYLSKTGSYINFYNYYKTGERGTLKWVIIG